MKIITPEDYSRKFGIEPELNDKPLPKLGSADLRPAQGEQSLRMTERESSSFYERGIVPDATEMGPAYQHRYDLQSTWDRAGNAFARGTIGALGVMLEDASYMTLQPLGEMTGVLDEWEQNAVAQWGEKLKQEAHERFPNYQADPSKLDWSPWAVVGDLIENGLGFAIPGVGAAKGVSMATKALRAGRVGAYASHLRKTMGLVGSTEKALNFMAPGFISNMAEGTMMGFETYKDLIAQGYSEEEASSAADEVLKNNRYLMLSDMIQLHGIYKGTKAMRNTMNNPSEWKQNIKSAFTTMNADNPVFQSLVEGGEEVFQGIIQREAESKVTTEGKQLRKDKGMLGRIGEYFKDESLWYEGALGFLSGGAQQMIMKEVGNAIDRNKYGKIGAEIQAVQAELAQTTDVQRKVVLESRIQDLTEEATRTTQQGMYEAQQTLIKETDEHLKHRFKQEVRLDVMMKEALASGDLSTVNALQSAKFRTVAYDNMARGTLDTLERQLKDMLAENLSEEEMKDRGYDKNYKAKIQSDLNLLDTLESDYITASGYINPSEVYHQTQHIRVVEEGLSGIMSTISDVINGTKDENNKVISQGLQAAAEAIANEVGASEFNFNKFIAGGLKLGDVEDVAEKNKLRTALEKITDSKEYKEYKELNALRKEYTDEISASQKFLNELKSIKEQQKVAEIFREAAKRREAQKKANIQKKEIIEKQQKAAPKASEQQGEELTPEAPSVVVPTPPVVTPTPKVSPEEKTDEEITSDVLGNVIPQGDQTINSETVQDLKDLINEGEKDESTERNTVLTSDSYKITTNQREYAKDESGNFVETSDDYKRDKDGNYPEDTVTSLDLDVKEGTKLVFEISEDTPIKGTITYAQHAEAHGVDINLIPIRILTEDGRFLGWVPSAKGNNSVSQLRSEIYSRLIDGEPLSGEITHRYDKTLFKLTEGKVMSGEEAFPDTDVLAVVRLNGKVEFSDGNTVPIPNKFKNPGFTHIILPNGNFVACYPNQIDEGHANMMVDAIEVFIRSIHPNNKGKKANEFIPTELMDSYNALKAAGYNPNSQKSLENFLSMYLFTVTPDKRYNTITEEERAMGITSPLAKYVMFAANGDNNLGNKPMVQIQSNGVAFLMDNQKTAHGVIGYSIGANTPYQVIEDAEWKDQLKQVILASYRNTSKEHFNKDVVDLQRDIQEDGTNKITSKKTPYNKLAKSGVSTPFKSTNMGTEENPNWVYSVNPIIRFTVNKEKVEATPKVNQVIDVKDEVTPTVQLDPKADIERRRQEELEKKVQILKDKRNALRGEDGVVPKENIAEWQQLGKDVIEAKNKATRGNNEGFIPIRTEKDGVLSGEDAINAENEIERVIQKIIKGEITIEQAVSFIHNKYKVLANENEFLLNYINDRTSNAPEIGNNKQSFPAWRKGKYDAELAALEKVEAKPKEELVSSTVAPEILAKVLDGSLDPFTAMEQLEALGLQNTPEYRRIAQIFEESNVNEEADAIILSYLEEGDLVDVLNAKGNLKARLNKKGILGPKLKILDYAAFLNEVNKFSDELDTFVKEALSLPASFKLARLASEQNGFMMFNESAFGFYDFAKNGFTKTNVTLMGKAMSDIVEDYLNTDSVMEFLHFSKIHKINCK